jgi:hypothetical protein
MIFSMTDAQGGQGGSSNITVVGVSDDSSCLNNSSPSSTPAAPSPTPPSANPSPASPSANPSPASPSANPSPAPPSANPVPGPSAPPTAPSHGISTAAIAGTVIASLLFLAVIITLGLFFLRKKLSQPSGNVRRLPGTLESEIDLSFARQVPVVTPYSVPQSYDRPYFSNADPSLNADPFQDPQAPSQPVTHYQMPSQYYRPGTFQSPSQHYPLVSGHTPQNPVTDPPTPSLYRTEPLRSTLAPSHSTSQRKAAMAGVNAHQPSRFILHTDADDDLPQPSEDAVIELPPQYSERRILGVANPTHSNAGHPPGNLRS